VTEYTSEKVEYTLGQAARGTRHRRLGAVARLAVASAVCVGLAVLLLHLTSGCSHRRVPAARAAVETEPLLRTTHPREGVRAGDADDPAIWIHPTDPSLSLVLGTLKQHGLDVYDLDGQVLQTINPGKVRYNNVDVAYGFVLGRAATDLAVVTDPRNDRLVIFRIDRRTRWLEDVTDAANGPIFTPPGQEPERKAAALGLALYRSPKTDRFYAFVTRQGRGEVVQLELLDDGGGRVKTRRVRSLALSAPEGVNPQAEGMVTDEDAGVLYLAQEKVGISKVPAEPNGDAAVTLVDAVAPRGRGLRADVEGLTIYRGAGGVGYLIASSQGDDTFAVFSLADDNRYLGSFRVADGEGIDGAERTDGAAAVGAPLGPRFPAGLLVVQDGKDKPGLTAGKDGKHKHPSTNFKFVAWEQVARAFTPPLSDTPERDLRVVRR
jgi:3-phytase